METSLPVIVRESPEVSKTSRLLSLPLFTQHISIRPQGWVFFTLWLQKSFDIWWQLTWRKWDESSKYFYLVFLSWLMVLSTLKVLACHLCVFFWGPSVVISSLFIDWVLVFLLLCFLIYLYTPDIISKFIDVCVVYQCGLLRQKTKMKRTG